jgi:hypothetical protein
MKSKKCNYVVITNITLPKHTVHAGFGKRNVTRVAWHRYKTKACVKQETVTNKMSQYHWTQQLSIHIKVVVLPPLGPMSPLEAAIRSPFPTHTFCLIYREIQKYWDSDTFSVVLGSVLQHFGTITMRLKCKRTALIWGYFHCSTLCTSSLLF